MATAGPVLRYDGVRGSLKRILSARRSTGLRESIRHSTTTDREQLARLLGASDTQMSYVDNAPAGHGLIKVGGAIVPFANELPKNTELYRLMSTRPGED